MKNTLVYCILFILIIVSCNPSPTGNPKEGSGTQSSIKLALAETLFRLDSALLSLQNCEQGDPDFGALWCPHCKLYHTRGAEAVFPFAYHYRLSNDTSYKSAAIDLANWLISRQEADGSWKETPEEWTGTTTDQLLMMVQAFPLLEEELQEAEKETWKNAMVSAGDYLEEVMDPGFASINYVATTAATMAVLNRLIPDPKYKLKAHTLARQVVAKMDEDHFITGEGGRVDGVKHGVDLTYNMEMSLWGLALYAKISGDDVVMKKVEASLRRHLWFINPDGSMDGSWGIRSNKWTCFGGGTSDGSQVLFSLLTDTDPAYSTAAMRNLDYLQNCMVDGFVGYGPQHTEAIGTPPCIYPTFAKAKNLAMAHAEVKKNQASNFASSPLPVDKPGMEFFPTLDVYRVRTKNFMATVTAYSYKDPKGSRSKYMFRPTGGAISALWLKDYGFLQASSQTEYHRWEPMHFPEMEGIRPLTPRIELTRTGDSSGSATTYYTNLFEFDASSNREELNGKFIIEAGGQLKNREQEDSGVSYNYRYVFDDNRVKKHVSLNLNGHGDTIRIVEPVITCEGSTVEQTDKKSILICKGETRVKFSLLSDNATLCCGVEQDQYRSVYPALTACPIVMTMVHDKDIVELVFEIEKLTGKGVCE